MTHSKHSSIELVASDAELDQIVPYAPIGPLLLQCLLGTGQRFSELALNGVAVCDVCPSVSLAFIDGDHVAEAEDCFVKLLKPHVGTTARKPLAWVKSVDLKRLVEASDSIFVPSFKKAHPPQRPHCSGTPLI